jgi:hypothetical protein
MEDLREKIIDIIWEETKADGGDGMLAAADRILAIPRIKEALEHPEGCDGG